MSSGLNKMLINQSQSAMNLLQCIPVIYYPKTYTRVKQFQMQSKKQRPWAKQAWQPISICAIMSNLIPLPINRMAAGVLRWYVQVTILWTVKERHYSLSTPFWQDNIILHLQQGEQHLTCCAFSRLISVHISTDILLNMSLIALLQVRLQRYAWRLLVRNTNFSLVTGRLTNTA